MANLSSGGNEGGKFTAANVGWGPRLTAASPMAGPVVGGTFTASLVSWSVRLLLTGASGLISYTRSVTSPVTGQIWPRGSKG